MALDLPSIRNQFPALRKPIIFFDNPGGTQVPQTVLDRMASYMENSNANQRGAFATSRDSDILIEEAQMAAADFLNASRSEEIVFGANMTTLTLHVSRSIARTLKPGDEIVVTRLDHDANVTPWTLIAEDCNCKVRWVDFHPEDGTLDLESFQSALEGQPRLVAFGYASNSLGTINPVSRLIRMAHDAGALVYVDAVQYAPHGQIDVQKLGCDFLVCSAYKFFGPHVGVLYGRYELLDRLFAYKVRPAPNDPPWKFVTGTPNLEGIVGTLGALDYLEWVGKAFGHAYSEVLQADYSGRRLALKEAMAAIREYEFEISRALIQTLVTIPGLKLFGIQDEERVSERVPTCSFILSKWEPLRLAEKLAQASINVWDGDFFAIEITKRLGLETSGGLLRVGPVHYNTVEEINIFGEALRRIIESIEH
jgi:cysteine desulfurase family protein (TIGR01976 family)